ncbi:MAG: UDP-N-acetylmuramate dehydrogenase [Alicyclobacillus sp.]|nr:UDP-N-acetylmuramate dehydrogenase [Alicyclobacillus sp.]
MRGVVTLEQLAELGIRHARLNEPLARHTTWRIGGPADVFVVPASVAELQCALRAAAQLGLPWTVLGRGSNVLVLDGGIRGLVLHLTEALAEVTVADNCLVAQAGRSMVSAAHLAVRHHLAGLEFATGIPGTVGGAVMMNAGAYGGEIKDVLLWADVMDTAGHLHRWYNADFRFAYRYSRLKDDPHVVVRAAFQLRPGDGAAMAEQVRTWALRRSQTQPLSLPNCGSVFRNPPGTYAGRLIEAAGLKGLRYGNAQISEKHANFIVNLGGARAEDVLWLMRHAQATVRERFGIQLETEVRILGEPASGR